MVPAGGIFVTGADYAELHCISNFTFLRGASHPEELVGEAHRLGYAALALTDECSLGGMVRAHQAAKAVGLRLIVGAEIRLEDGLRFVLLARNRAGYGQLCALITQGRRAAAKGSYRLCRGDLGDLSGCLALWLPDRVPDPGQLEFMKHRFDGDLWICVERLLAADDVCHMERLGALGSEYGVPLVASSDVHMHRRSRRMLQDTLTAIRLGIPVAAAAAFLHPNGERHLRPLSRLRALYPEELRAQTIVIAERCRFSLDELHYEYPHEWLPEGTTPRDYLRLLVEEGASRRWPDGVPARILVLITRELGIIADLGYEAYFLTVHDIVAFARARGILCQGRGSAANSAVCYCLGITEVDPMRIDVLFERFVSRERNEPPDIDVDFEHERREEVVQYLFAKYGRDRAAMTASIITYRLRSALRDVARALGIEAEMVSRMASSVSWWDHPPDLPGRFTQAGIPVSHPTTGRLIRLVQALAGFPRHLSQHVGGMVLSAMPLAHMVPIENAAMAGRTVIQWDKNDLDVLGMLKIDCLALGMLTAIRKAFALIGIMEGRTPGFQDIPPEDPDVYAMIRKADTVGVFQIESRAQMAMLPRLKPATFYDLVIQIAIVRPGPIQGEMVHPYLRRRDGIEAVRYPSHEVRQVLERTLGVPIFQEQVIKLAMVAAGFSPGEADQLRRSMAAWHRSGMLGHFEQRLVNGMRARGYPAAYARQIFRQIQGFGDYGFPESHAASFALLAYVSAWLKRRYPEAFVCALLNSQPMGFYAPAQLIQDARRHGVRFLPVDVMHSDWDSTLERDGPGGGFCVRLGFREIKGLSREGFACIRSHRSGNSGVPWEHLPLSVRDRRCLAESGACERLFGHRRRAHWRLQRPLPPPLWRAVPFDEGIPLLERPRPSEEVIADYRQLGFSLRGHPMDSWRSQLTRAGVLSAAGTQACAHGDPVVVAGIVIIRQRPATASGVIFLTLEDESGSVNVVVWGTIAERDRQVLLRDRLLVSGRLQREGQVMHVIAERLIPWDEMLMDGDARVRRRLRTRLS
ncbi:MAG: error-prone DNA polymerase [Acidiferrobacteraceae bacterium]